MTPYKPNCGALTVASFVTALWLHYILACSLFGYSVNSIPMVHTGAQFADALMDETLTLLIVMDDIILSEADFPSDRVILLERNLTIEAGDKTARDSSDAVIDFNHVKQKLRLGANITLTLRRIVLVRFRAGSISASPGFDVLLPTQVPRGSQPALIRIDDSLVILPWCYPAVPQAQNIKLFMRPSSLPGVQNVTLQMSQMGCANDSRVPLRQRCWPSVGMYNDLGVTGHDMERYTLVPNNYTMWLVNTMYACKAILTEDCIAALGPVGCLYRAIAQDTLRQAAPPSGTPPPCRCVMIPALVGSLGAAALLASSAAIAGLVLRRRQRRAAQARWSMASGTESGAGSSRMGISSRESVIPQQRQQDDGLVGVQHKALMDGPYGVGQDFDGATEADNGSRMAVFSCTTHEAVDRVDTPNLDLQVVVTPLTPPRPDLAMGVECGNEVMLLPVLRGKGSFGRVHEGLYSGQRVAVKLLPYDAVLVAAALPLSPPAAAPDDGGAAATGSGAVAAAAAACECGGQAADGPAEAVPAAVEQAKKDATQPPQEPAADGCGGGGGIGGCGVGGCGGGMKPTRALQMFAQEVEVLGRCCHPNVVRLLAACLGPPQPCLVMELMETSLDKLLHRGDTVLLPMSTVLRIAIDVVRGLEYLHPTVVHRDLKPANVLVNISGPVLVAKIADFGLSRMRSTVMPTKHPEAGTPAYMAPECFDTHNLRITHQADIYSFAVVVWEMLTGLLPWWGRTPLAVAYSVTLLGDRLPLSGIPPERCPAALAMLLTQCFDAEPRRRPAAAELVKELELVAKGMEADQIAYNTTSNAAAAASPPEVGTLAPSVYATFTNSDTCFKAIRSCHLSHLVVGSSLVTAAMASTESGTAVQ